MELEFDNEIDAILRKTRGGGSPSGIGTGSHLDADAIAAFVENAIPASSKPFYIKHFADCDRCRGILAHAISIQEAAALSSAAEALLAKPVSAAARIPWYSRLLRGPNLAVAMGGLLLLFGIGIALLLLQNSQNGTSSNVAMLDQKSASGPAPIAANATSPNTSALPGPPSNSSANLAITGTAASNTSAATSKKEVVDPSPSQDNMARAEGSGEPPVAQPRSETTVVTPPAGKPVPSAPPRPVDDEKDRDRSASDMTLDGRAGDSYGEDVVAKRKLDTERNTRDSPAPPAKVGPVRGDGPAQSAQINNNIFDMAVSRSFNGKTFENRNGIWYDRAYRSQSLTSVKRGTDEYKKLDGGLRKIADQLGGTVIVVWKSKAYRVQ